ncbi:CinA family protein [Kitasatospora sp. NPDC101801]|uniref:CinA family protein n=1 Tax=Kitasatospora sp. NPDC101801 TaxID=3364103 RepID=UPI003817A6F3
MSSTPEHAGLTRQILAALAAAESTLSVAESLTGGLLAFTVAEAPGAGEVFLGSVTAYATAVKADILKVDPDLLEARGPVDPQVAEQMAEGVRRLLGSTYALATTGVAGPAPQDGHEPGTVYIALAAPDRTCSLRLDVSGNRRAVQGAAVGAALTALRDRLRPASGVRHPGAADAGGGEAPGMTPGGPPTPGVEPPERGRRTAGDAARHSGAADREGTDMSEQQKATPGSGESVDEKVGAAAERIQRALGSPDAGRVAGPGAKSDDRPQGGPAERAAGSEPPAADSEAP